MSSTFVDHFDALPARLDSGEEPPRPLDSERYYDDYDSNQSGTCAQLAVEFYNQQQGNYSPITLEHAKDSHKFFSEGTAYFHVNFKAALDGGSGPCYTFFAEVKGPGVPESVTMVVQFHTKGRIYILHDITTSVSKHIISASINSFFFFWHVC